MARLQALRPREIFADVATDDHRGGKAGLAVLKSYRYLRLGTLVAVAALAYSIVREARHPGVHCLLGSISAYYYTPAKPILIGVFVVLGLAMIVIKGRTWQEDACLTIAGVMAPVVAFVPTSDDSMKERAQDVCRTRMVDAGRYVGVTAVPTLQKGAASTSTTLQDASRASAFAAATIENNLWVLWFAGALAVVVAIAAAVGSRLRRRDMREYTTGTWIMLGLGAALAIVGWLLLEFAYGWVLDGHARAATAVFLFLALAALTNAFPAGAGSARPADSDTHTDTEPEPAAPETRGSHATSRRRRAVVYRIVYGAVGVGMLVSGLVFALWGSLHSTSSDSGHAVLTIEIIEIALFATFWLVQTIERWHDPV